MSGMHVVLDKGNIGNSEWICICWSHYATCFTYPSFPPSDLRPLRSTAIHLIVEPYIFRVYLLVEYGLLFVAPSEFAAGTSLLRILIDA